MFNIYLSQVALFMLFPLVNYNLIDDTLIYLASLMVIIPAIIVKIVFSPEEKYIQSNEVQIDKTLKFLYYIIAISTLIHAYISFDNLLFFRRVGTSGLIELISNTPALHYFILRIIESIFIFLIFMYVYFAKKNNQKIQLTIFIFYIIFVFFSSTWTSRSDLIIHFLLYIFILAPLGSNNFNLTRMFGFFSIILSIFILQTFARHGFNFSLVQGEFVYISERLNTWILASSFFKENLNFIFGEFNFESYKYYVTLFPFSDMAYEYKSLGLTNFKSYLLYDILGTDVLDNTYNFTIDILYNFGLLGLFFLSTLLSVLFTRIDSVIRSGNVNTWAIIYFMLGFSLLRIEFEFLSNLLAFIRVFILMLTIIIITQIIYTNETRHYLHK
jgi:hypothetical protein